MKNFKDTYFSIWQEAWAIHKRFFGIAEDDAPAWEQLFQAAEAFEKKVCSHTRKTVCTEFDTFGCQ